MSNRTIIARQEGRAFVRDRLQLTLFALFAGICVFAIVEGARYRTGLTASAVEFRAEEVEEAEAWRDRVVAMEAGEVAPADDPWAGLAMDVVRPAIAEPGPLADLAHGVTDVHPYTARVSLWRSVDRLFGNYQFQNPNAVRAGQVDLAFVVLFLLPLLMIAVSFGVLADDRDSGRLALVMAQPVSVRELVTTKLAVRLGAVFALLLLALLGALLVGSGGVLDSTRLARSGIWVALATSYFMAWAGLIYWAVSLNRTGEVTVLLLVGSWALNSLVAPALLTASAQALLPAPSQMAFLSSARDVSNDAYRAQSDVMEGMLLDHPELNVDNYTIPEYIRTAYLVTQTVDRQVGPVLDEFDAVQADRRRFLGVVQYLAPSAVAMQAMNLTAGTDLERQIRFEREVREYKHAIAAYVEQNVLAGERLTVAQIDGIPAFTFSEVGWDRVVARVGLPLSYLVVLGLFFGWRATGRLGRLQTRLRET